jgi:2-oxoglutarate dehydrogenase complex dehydrogenase (E1) component-like enzyme
VKAEVDPLNLREISQSHRDLLRDNYTGPTNSVLHALDYRTYGFTQADLEREFYIDASEMGGFMAMKKTWKLKDLISSLEHAYCNKLAIEYAHITN